MMYDLIISGGSITNGGWPTWKDFVEGRYNIKSFCSAQKGLGNEAIISQAILQSQKVKNPIIAVMLTTVDKWDWYIQDKNVLQKLQKEKHIPIQLHKHDQGGMWCTGSWFPNQKEYYLKNYYSLDYQVIKTCMLIHYISSYCKASNIPLLILYDSPIFQYTEQELNSKPTYKSSKTLINDTTQPFFDLVKLNQFPSLIYFCMENKIPWFHSLYKWHPGSLAHYKFSYKYIFPCLDQYFDIINNDQLHIAKKMNELWNYEQ